MAASDVGAAWNSPLPTFEGGLSNGISTNWIQTGPSNFAWWATLPDGGEYGSNGPDLGAMASRGTNGIWTSSDATNGNGFAAYENEVVISFPNTNNGALMYASGYGPMIGDDLPPYAGFVSNIGPDMAAFLRTRPELAAVEAVKVMGWQPGMTNFVSTYQYGIDVNGTGTPIVSVKYAPGAWNAGRGGALFVYGVEGSSSAYSNDLKKWWWHGETQFYDVPIIATGNVYLRQSVSVEF